MSNFKRKLAAAMNAEKIEVRVREWDDLHELLGKYEQQNNELLAYLRWMVDQHNCGRLNNGNDKAKNKIKITSNEQF